MRNALWLVVLRVATLVALGVSGALLVDYVSHDPAFCSPGSGCSAVRASGYGYLFDGKLPVPAVGIAAFAGLFAVSLARGLRAFLFPVAAVGGVLAAGLLALQAKIGHFCALCVAVDSAGIVAAVAAYLDRRSPPARDPFAPWAWSLFAVAAVAAPSVWPRVRPLAPVPPGIASYFQPGKINVVEFADYECPFCRALHPVLKKLVKEREGQVNFVRLNMPLPRHPGALGAAKAAVCAEAQGKGEAMADLLFEVEDLSAPALRRLAERIGLHLPAFDACVASPGTTDRIQRESKLLRDAGFQGLPTTYVGARQIVGARSEELFREAFDAAARGDSGGGVSAPVFSAILALVVGGIAFLGRAHDEEPAPGTRARARREDDEAGAGDAPDEGSDPQDDDGPRSSVAESAADAGPATEDAGSDDPAPGSKD